MAWHKYYEPFCLMMLPLAASRLPTRTATPRRWPLVGPMLLAVAFERQPFRALGVEPLLSVARFALEVARGAQEHGIALRGAACSGEGAVFDDANGRPAVASPAAQCAAELLAALRSRSQQRSAFALIGASPLLVQLLGQRLSGWEKALDGPEDATVWVAAS